jgi:hypothetical protein
MCYSGKLHLISREDVLTIVPGITRATFAGARVVVTVANLSLHLAKFTVKADVYKIVAPVGHETTVVTSGVIAGCP